MEKHHYQRPLRVGSAGGLGSPNAIAAAFTLGSAYVLTGSVNQCTIESELGSFGKKLLMQAKNSDVAMAPAADMFELGAGVQVLTRGTMFAPRARKLRMLFLRYSNWQAIPKKEQIKIERDILRESFAQAWASTKAWWLKRDKNEVLRAKKDPKHRMALVFRAYLGQASHWAIKNDPQRRADYQIWCGPAMGAFNHWVKDSFLEPLENRTVVQIAKNLMEGAAVLQRAQQLRSLGVDVPNQAFNFRPRKLI